MSQPAASADTTEDDKHLVLETFKAADANRVGTLDFNEVRGLLKKCTVLTDSQIELIFKEFAADGDGKLNYEELITWLWCGQDCMVLYDVKPRA